MKELKNILIISSASPTVAAGVVALDYYKALLQAGYNVDFFTKYKNNDYPNFFYIYDDVKNNIFKKIQSFVHRVCFKIYRVITRRDYQLLFQRYFFYKHENIPPVSNKKIIDAIPEDRKYDLIITLFWQEMMSAISLEALYDKYKCSIFIICVDYSPMTGGCHFISDCKTFQKGCGACECWYSQNLNDFTRKNVLEKLRVYNKIKPIVFINRYMEENYACNAPVLKNLKRITKGPVINEDLFCPVNKNEIRKELQLPEDKKIIFFACQNLNDARKGGKLVLEALEIFYKTLTEIERKEILIILAGKAEKEIASQISFKSKLFGYVGTEKLVKLYQVADVYLSGSVIDAGPMMVNQALSCGVPVIAFNIGTAIDVINGKNTGYVAEEISSKSFADGIKWWYKLSPDEYENISKNCRNMALSTTSYKVIANILTNTYYSF